MSMFRKLALAGIATLSMAALGADAMAQQAGGNGRGGQAGTTDSSGTRVWSHKGAADGVILCATRQCMDDAEAGLPFAAAPGGPNQRRPLPVDADNCGQERYVYPTGVVIIKQDCPRAILGTIATHR